MINFVSESLSLLSAIFVFIAGLAVIWAICAFFIDITQTKDAVRRNYPLVGRFRHLFTELGEFFRQYFFAMDREEMPFNRAERDWVERASSSRKNTVAFGSTKSLLPTGTPIFVNCPFPYLEEEDIEIPTMVIGPYSREPYEAKSVINISGMSYGALSRPAVKALSKGAARADCWLNTGEGGVSPHHLSGNCDLVFQIGTAKYGVRNKQGGLSDEKLKEVAAMPQVKMFEIKLAQGAKPGKGGILPAAKVNAEIASIRGIEEGQASISPNRHPEINSVGELLDMIGHIREVSGKPVGFKTVIGAFGWVEEMCEEIAKRGVESAPDFITIDSGDGGTGAAPMPLIDNVGLLVREALPIVANILAAHDLRGRIKVIASGKFITPADAAWGLCAGADFIVTARGAMFALGCIQAMKCNKNTCPTGITTHDPRFQRGLVPKEKAQRVASYIKNLVHEVDVIANSCGVLEPRGLRRYHVRMMQDNGKTIPLDELYPWPEGKAPAKGDYSSAKHRIEHA
ncbi:MAG: FMN-binding glutamate synthase family protein [Pseudomonadota bacterium]